MRIAIGAVFFAGCSVVALDVGSDSPQAVTTTDAGDAGDAAPDAPATLLQRLAARCAAPPGTADYPANAAELSVRLHGRWYACQLDGDWSAPPTAVAFAPGPSGTYAFLVLNAAGDGFDESAAPGDVGGLQYLAPGGVGQPPSEMIAFDDTSPRNGFVLDLVRGGDRADFQFIPSFEQNPRRLRLSELGADPAIGTFVPID